MSAACCRRLYVISFSMNNKQIAVLMASALVLCACGDGRITDAKDAKEGERYVAEKNPETGEMELRPESTREKLIRKTGEIAVDSVSGK